MAYKIPKIGDIFYIGSAGYIDSPGRDVKGGKARVVSVGKRGNTYWVTFEGLSAEYNWDFLEGMQDYLKKQFGKQWACRG